MKRSPADAWFSKCVRERSNWNCEYCKKNFEHHQSSLHCSHFYGRRARVVRWSGDNAFAHCIGCHKQLSENPGEFSAWAIHTRGDGWFELLQEKWRGVRRKISKLEEKEIAKHYKEQFEIMQKKRNVGENGWLEFTNYD